MITPGPSVGKKVWLAHTHQRDIYRPQLSSQFAVNLQKDLLSDAVELLRLRDGPHVKGLGISVTDSDMISNVQYEYMLFATNR